MTAEIWSILLAAGGSRRLGRPKQLVRLQGCPLIRRAALRCLDATPGRCVVVLGAKSVACRAALQGLPVKLTGHLRWREGQASSLRAGLRALPRSATGALVVLVDQWNVDARHLATLIHRWRRQPQRPVATLFAGRLMAPALFPRRVLPELMKLHGDSGARELLARLQPAVGRVTPSRAPQDLDTPADLGRARTGQQGRLQK